jgi:hypothetical protein
MPDPEAVDRLVSHRYFQPHVTPIQLLNRAMDPFLPLVRRQVQVAVAEHHGFRGALGGAAGSWIRDDRGSGARRGSNRGSSPARGNLPVARFGILGPLLADDETSTEVLVAGTRLRVLLTALVVQAQ